jgi:hypothetical protein
VLRAARYPPSLRQDGAVILEVVYPSFLQPRDLGLARAYLLIVAARQAKRMADLLEVREGCENIMRPAQALRHVALHGPDAAPPEPN